MIYKCYELEQNINLIKEPIFLFYGENEGLKSELKKKIVQNNKNADIINFLQDDVIKAEESFFNDIFNISLFEKEKIYIISQANDKILDIIQSVQSKLEKQKVFLFAEILDKKSKLRNYFEKTNNCGVTACYPDNEITFKKLVLNKLNGFNGLNSKVVNLIVTNSGLDRIKLNNELEKISTFFKEKTINETKLELLLNDKTNEDFDILKDVALNGNFVETNRLLSDTILDTEKSFFYLNAINQRLSKLEQINNLAIKTSIEEAVNNLKPPIFWKDKNTVKNQAKKWNISKIKDLLKQNYNIEISLKSKSSVNKDLIVKKLLLDICVLANS